MPGIQTSMDLIEGWSYFEDCDCLMSFCWQDMRVMGQMETYCVVASELLGSVDTYGDPSRALYERAHISRSSEGCYHRRSAYSHLSGACVLPLERENIPHRWLDAQELAGI